MIFQRGVPRAVKSIRCLTIVGALFAPHLAIAEEFVCPSAEIAREAFGVGEAAAWPNYTEGTAARVQRQHPNTGLWAQAKFIDWNTKSAAICQYYSHVGLLMTMVEVGFERGAVDEGSFWREEFAEESEDLDQPGKEMLWTCMKREGAADFPSIGCRFSRTADK